MVVIVEFGYCCPKHHVRISKYHATCLALSLTISWTTYPLLICYIYTIFFYRYTHIFVYYFFVINYVHHTNIYIYHYFFYYSPLFSYFKNSIINNILNPIFSSLRVSAVGTTRSSRRQGKMSHTLIFLLKYFSFFFYN